MNISRRKLLDIFNRYRDKIKKPHPQYLNSTFIIPTQGGYSHLRWFFRNSWLVFINKKPVRYSGELYQKINNDKECFKVIAIGIGGIYTETIEKKTKFVLNKKKKLKSMPSYLNINKYEIKFNTPIFSYKNIETKVPDCYLRHSTKINIIYKYPILKYASIKLKNNSYENQ